MANPSSSQDSFNILGELENTRIQRELAISQLMERRRIAYRMAEEREKFNWSISGGVLTSVMSCLSSYHHKNLIHLLPIIPIAAYIGYSAHYCYGNKLAILDQMANKCLDDIENSSISAIKLEDVRQKLHGAKNEEEIFKF